MESTESPLLSPALAPPPPPLAVDGGALLTADELAPTQRRPEPIVYIRARSWCCIFHGFGQLNLLALLACSRRPPVASPRAETLGACRGAPWACAGEVSAERMLQGLPGGLRAFALTVPFALALRREGTSSFSSRPRVSSSDRSSVL